MSFGGTTGNRDMAGHIRAFIRLPVLRSALNRQPSCPWGSMNPAFTCSSFAFHITSIHNRMTTFLEPRDYAEYLEPTERSPVHLLRVLDADAMRSTLIEKSPITNQQVSLFDSH